MKKRYLNKKQLRALEFKNKHTTLSIPVVQKKPLLVCGVVVVVVGEDSSKENWLEQLLSLSPVIIILGMSVVAPFIKGFPSILGCIWNTSYIEKRTSCPMKLH
uniref:Uncharacterized protein n=1 Tax=Sphaerodactylus townsendi TaxID=933632 RepID=A0ACB8G2I6_9SAUR